MSAATYIPVRSPEELRTRTSVPSLLLVAAVLGSIPLENTTVLAEIGSIARLLGVLAAGVVIIDAVMSQGFRRLHPAHAPLALFVIWCAFTCLWSVNQALSLERFRTNVQLLLMLWVIWQSVRTPGQLRFVLQGYVLGCCCAAVLTFANARDLVAVDQIRYSGAGADPNEMGLMLAISLPMSYYLLRTRRTTWSGFLWLLAMPLCIAGTILTVSRGAFLSTIGALISISIWHVTSASRMRFAPLIAGAVLLVAGLSFAPKADLERIGSIEGELASGRIGKRARLWKAGMVLIEKYPLTGVGAGTFAYAVEPLIGRELAAHNTYVSVLVEDGIPGLAIFVLVLATLLITAMHFNSPERFLWLTAVAIWCIGVGGLTFEYKKTTWAIFGMLIATAGVLGFTKAGPVGQSAQDYERANPA
jgi:O-antigen ligase